MTKDVARSDKLRAFNGISISDQKNPRFDDLVAMARAPTPDPIPNSAVKSLSANGTAS